MKVLRSLILVHIGPSGNSLLISDKVLHDLLTNLKFLRVFSLCHCRIVEVPNCVGELKHLRYLNFSNTSIRRLPESIGDLCKLQALILRGCHQLSKLPHGITKLVSLQFLDVRDTKSLKEMPSGINNLKNLTILSKFVVGTEKGLQLKELKNLSHLQGELFILKLQKVEDVRDGVDANLFGKQGLRKLFLHWDKDLGILRNDKRESRVLESLQPPIDIENLTILNYGGAIFSSWLDGSSYSRIVSLSLWNCPYVTSLPSFGQLPSLRQLSLKGLNAVRIIGSIFLWRDVGMEGLVSLCRGPKEEVPFSCLEHLIVRSCPSLVKTLPCQLDRLIKLEIHSCQQLNNSTSELCLPSLDELYLEDCSKEILKSLFKLTSLTILKINKLIELVSFDHRFMSCLDNCKGVESLEGIAVESLEIMTISDCQIMGSLPQCLHMLSHLTRLHIYNCPTLEIEDFPPLPLTLSSLVLNHCSKIKSIANCNIANCNNLTKLEIWECPILEIEDFPPLPITL
ncbi:hypothetical protein EUGRSUZ_B01077 [Eucalyptus grandis]|uniref:Uncharacterized protein n=1 Tax=Eucalyptus grandis TaxID=71139 RepID=A0ACC3LQW3_EUCGR|nr:hypothetical protein EUGRSUZ_B01077 [Eucalyptus grandis]